MCVWFHEPSAGTLWASLSRLHFNWLNISRWKFIKIEFFNWFLRKRINCAISGYHIVWNWVSPSFEKMHGICRVHFVLRWVSLWWMFIVQIIIRQSLKWFIELFKLLFASHLCVNLENWVCWSHMVSRIDGL